MENFSSMFSSSISVNMSTHLREKSTLLMRLRKILFSLNRSIKFIHWADKFKYVQQFVENDYWDYRIIIALCYSMVDSSVRGIEIFEFSKLWKLSSLSLVYSSYEKDISLSLSISFTCFTCDLYRCAKYTNYRERCYWDLCSVIIRFSSTVCDSDF